MNTYIERLSEDDFRNFECEFKKLMKGYMNNYADIIYILSYLCFKNSQLNYNPYNNFDEYLISYDFGSFIDAIRRSFDNFDSFKFNKHIVEECLDYLKEMEEKLKYVNINIKSLMKLLKTRDLYFYEKILTENVLRLDDLDIRTKEENTPNEIIELINYLMVGDSILDIGSGNGNTLLGMHRYNRTINCMDGVEINLRKAFISKLRLSCICGHNNVVNSQVYNEDYFNCNIDKKYSLISINMPFGLHIDNVKRNEINHGIKSNYMFDWVITPGLSSEWIYINRALKLLKKKGRIVVVSLRTQLFKTSDLKQRKDLIDNNLIEYVIDMPEGTYPNTCEKYSVIVLNNSKTDDLVKFVNGSECYIKQENKNRIDVNRLKGLIVNNVIVRNKKEIQENEYNLCLNTYLESEVNLKSAVKLGDLNVEINRGLQLFQKSDSTENGEYSIITVGDIDENGNINSNLLRFDTKKDLNKYIVKKNDILVVTKGTKIKTCIVGDLDNEKTIYHGNLTLIRVCDDRLDPVYLKLYLDSDIGQEELKRIQTGAKIISINTTQLNKIKIPLLSIEEQNNIVEEYKKCKVEIDELNSILNEKSKLLSELINNSFEIKR